MICFFRPSRAGLTEGARGQGEGLGRGVARCRHAVGDDEHALVAPLGPSRHLGQRAREIARAEGPPPDEPRRRRAIEAAGGRGSGF